MKRHRLVCLKRLSDAALANSPVSQPSPPSTVVNQAPINNSPPNQSRRNVNEPLDEPLMPLMSQLHLRHLWT